MTPESRPSSGGGDREKIVASYRTAIVGVGLASGVLNVLMLTGSFYMLEIYDRVVPSRSLPTLIGLTTLVVVLFIFQGFLDFARSRVLVHIGASIDEKLSESVFHSVLRLPLMKANGGEGLLALRDLDQIRSFFGGAGLPAFFDLPWVPLYVAICFVLHPALGFTAAAAAVFMFALTLMTEYLSKSASKDTTRFGTQRFASAESARRNAEVVRAMGMSDALAAPWRATNEHYVNAQLRASNIAGGLGSFARSFRMLLQSLVLGLGAFLVIHDQASGGVIIAGSILTARALAPIDMAIANWKTFISAREAWFRLSELTAATREPPLPLRLPAPRRDLVIESLTITPPGESRLVVRDVGFSLKAGAALGVVGPSAAGKSSLLKAIVGIWPAVRGTIRIDGATLDQFSPTLLGPHVGYLPQDVELFSGTIARNIARFEEKPDPDKVIAAAEAAGAHELIKRLPNGYETQIGQAGHALSAGQRQRVALARALYGDPFLVVLDEPNSNLDAEGEQALTKAVLSVRARGGIVIIAAHRFGALDAVDSLLIMNGGALQSFGNKSELLGAIGRNSSSHPATVSPIIAGATAR
jgi:ATP-binding cassette, subfamily C, type I secretion system permease/ATPase